MFIIDEYEVLNFIELLFRKTEKIFNYDVIIQ